MHARCPAVRVCVTSVKEMRFIYWLIYIKEYDKGGNNVLLTVGGLGINNGIIINFSKVLCAA